MSTPPLNQNEFASGVCLSRTVGERKNEVRICGSLLRDPICHTTTTICVHSDERECATT